MANKYGERKLQVRAVFIWQALNRQKKHIIFIARIVITFYRLDQFENCFNHVVPYEKLKL